MWQQPACSLRIQFWEGSRSRDRNLKSRVFNVLALFVASRPAFAAISSQCRAESEQLATNAALVAVAPRGGCNVNTDGGSCTFDFAPISGQFERKCEELGGQFIEQDLTFDCKVRGDDADFHFLNYPTCAGSSCDPENIDKLFDTVGSGQMEREMAAQGFDCDITNSAAGRGASAYFVLLGAFSMIGWILI